MSVTACRIDPDPFFAAKPALAKALCGGCPLLEECRAQGWDEEHGVWGGMSAVDRRRADPERYDAAVAAGRATSQALDAQIVTARATLDREQQAAA